jgi:hypothetical protein
MRIVELTEGKELDEASPMGLLSKLGRKIQSYVPGGTGEAGKAHLDVGNRANQLNNAFSNYAIRAGINLNNVPKKELQDFLSQQQLPAIKFNQNSYNLKDKEQAKNVWYSIAQAAYRQTGSAYNAPAYGQQYGTAPTDDGQAAVAPAPASTAPSMDYRSAVAWLSANADQLTPAQKQKMVDMLQPSAGMSSTGGSPSRVRH